MDRVTILCCWEIESLVLNMVNLKCLSDIQVELSSRQFEIQALSPEGSLGWRSALESHGCMDVFKKQQLRYWMRSQREEVYRV